MDLKVLSQNAFVSSVRAKMKCPQKMHKLKSEKLFTRENSKLNSELYKMSFLNSFLNFLFRIIFKLKKIDQSRRRAHQTTVLVSVYKDILQKVFVE